ncbi:MAG: hypothetical protein GX443_13475 [Deltaproteobacteria bacterium]|nr:hypothetical protein [Deltaproteobacteria bacterium]
MESVVAIWERFTKFLSEYDSHALSEAIRNLDWGAAVSDPVTWLIVLPPLVFCVFKKALRFLLLMGSLVALVFLLQHTMPPSGQSMPLNKLLEFIGGSLVLVVLNLYFLFMKS